MREIIKTLINEGVETHKIVNIVNYLSTNEGFMDSFKSGLGKIKGAVKGMLNKGDSQKEEPKIEEPKIEEPKVEEPKVEEPKVEEPKVEEPKKYKKFDMSKFSMEDEDLDDKYRAPHGDSDTPSNDEFENSLGDKSAKDLYKKYNTLLGAMNYIDQEKPSKETMSDIRSILMDMDKIYKGMDPDLRKKMNIIIHNANKLIGNLKNYQNEKDNPKYHNKTNKSFTVGKVDY